MNFKEIQELIKSISESNLTCMELEKDGFKIVLKKDTEKIGYGEMVTESFLNKYPGVQALPAETQNTAQDVINSPIVGTFYAASSPAEKPFVQAGSKVKKGDVLCIIEAMKLMNEIEADEDLIISEVLVQDGQMVEYGQPLFAVKRA